MKAISNIPSFENFPQPHSNEIINDNLGMNTNENIPCKGCNVVDSDDAPEPHCCTNNPPSIAENIADIYKMIQ